MRIERDTWLYVGIAPPAAGVSWTVTARVRDASGVALRVRRDGTTAGSSGQEPTRVLLPVGNLEAVTVEVGATPRCPWAAWAVVRLIRRSELTEELGPVLCCGPCGGPGGLVWPGGRMAQLGEAGRAQGVVGVTAPAAGADWSVTVDGWCMEAVTLVSCRLVTDVNVATRTGNLSITPYGGSEVLFWPGTLQTASLTRWYCFYPGCPSYFTSGQNIFAPMARVGLRPGDVLASYTGNKQVGDQWSDVQVWGYLAADESAP